MKRPMLVSGVTMFIVAAFLMNFSKAATISTLLIGALAFVLFLIKPLKLRRFVIIPAVSLSAILICTSLLTYNSTKIEPNLKLDSTTAYVSGKVITTPVNIDGCLTFTLKTDENIKIYFAVPCNNSECPVLYDYVSIENAELSVARNEKNQFDLTGASDGVLLSGTGSEAEVLWQCEKTPYYYCLHFKDTVSKRIDDFLPSPTSAIIKGLIFGGSQGIPKNIANGFRNGGISHLLAVSGLHTSLWCGLIILIFNLLHIPRKIRNIFCIIFLFGFCVVTGFTPSVLRSSLMSLVLLTSPYTKTLPDSLNSLGLVVSALLMCNPYLVYSLSFQLSLCATLGVLLVSRYEMSVYRLLYRKLKFKPVRAAVGYVICSFLISMGAGIFTMPVSALNFNTFSTVSPVTNLLCVKPAFYAMICGTLGTATSYIELPVIRKLTLFLFDVTECLITFVCNASLKITEFAYSTIPVHKEWLLNGLFLGSIILLIGCLIYKIKSNKALVLSSVLTIIAVFVNIFIPLLPTPYRDTVTVVSSGDNLNVIIRSGTHYAYIINSDTEYPSDVYDYLPKATCESLDYWLVTYLSYSSCSDLERLPAVVKPKEIYTTPEIRNICIKKNVELPQNTIINTQGKYTLNGEINFEIIDTYRIKYVIIRGNEKTVYIHLHGSADFSKVVDTGDGDIFIYNSRLPDSISPSAETVIISGGAEFIKNSDYNNLSRQHKNILLSALEGDVQINV